MKSAVTKEMVNLVQLNWNTIKDSVCYEATTSENPETFFKVTDVRWFRGKAQAKFDAGEGASFQSWTNILKLRIRM